ncbi:GGDEF domain-containing response regulator [Ectothiorhodospiraceae bacterium WFHF3C12]|nr:GGDEF domain-containing response regulator [Ectothiorhodospiraceae bacterium WFHF3C12]
MPPDVLKVAVIEDDDEDFVLVSEALKAAQRTRFEIVHAAGLAQGRLALLDDSYDVFLVDYFLDENSADSLISEARRLSHPSPLVVLTGADSRDLDDRLIEMGAADFLPKRELAPALLERTIRHAVDRKQSENQMARLVKQDALTGLGNRQLFEENVERAISRARRHNGSFAIIFLDLDRFKEVNDTLGHHVGDLLLILVADRLQRATRDSDFVARISGDEFTLLLDDIRETGDAEIIAEKLLDTLRSPTPIHDVTLNITASLGVACFPEHGDTPMELMQKADMALYESKRAGSGRYRFFSQEMQARLERNIDMEQGLRHALDAGELSLHFQPIWRLSDRRTVAAEALLRWRHPAGYMVSPAEFIPVAERTGLILPVGNWVLDEACRFLRRLDDAGHSRLDLAINVSPRQLGPHTFTETVERHLAAHGVEASRLELELTEETFIETGDEMKSLLTDFRKLGCSIAIDDFGTGYSSLRYLKHFPVHRLKIDKSFISGDGADVAEPAITQAIVNLAKSLGLTLVAEGVETPQQADFLLAEGCQFGQGFLVAPPMEADEFIQFLQNQHRDGPP